MDRDVMANVSRRAMVGGLVGSAATLALGGQALANGALARARVDKASGGGAKPHPDAKPGATKPAATKPAATGTTLPNGSGFYRVMVGNAEVVCIADGSGEMAGSPFPMWGANGTKAEVDAALDAEFLPREGSRFYFNCALVRSGTDVMLMDLGNGTGGGPGAGKLLPHLANLGVKPSDVTCVVFSHLHPDHFGGLTDDNGELVFDKARYFISRDESDFWSRAGVADIKGQIPDEFKKGMVAGAAGVLAKLKGKLEMADATTKLSEGLRLVSAPGHTAGHQMLMVESGAKRLAVVADLVHHVAISLRRPDLHIQFDADPAAGAATRQRVLAQLASDKTEVLAYHMPFPGFGHVRPEGKGYQWVPSLWQW